MRKVKRLGTVILTAAVMLSMLADAALPGVRAANGEASTIRLARTEGTVMLTDKAGKTLTKTEGMRLFTGNTIATTADKSYAWMNLDDTKAAKLDAYSEAVIEKSGKNLSIKLNAGDIFFDVKEKLAADESFEIRTSTMVMGIRGTIGAVRAVDANRATIMILEGEVQVTVTNPQNGETATGIVHAGEIGETDAMAIRQGGTTAVIKIRRINAPEIPGFILTEIAGGNVADGAGARFQPAGGENILSRRIYDATQQRLDLRGVQPQEALERLAADQSAVQPGFFDPAWYASKYPDVAAACGTSVEALQQHYQTLGQNENRQPNAGAAVAAEQKKQQQTKAWAEFYEEQQRLIAEEKAREEEARLRREQEERENEEMEGSVGSTGSEQTSSGSSATKYSISSTFGLFVPSKTSASAGEIITITNTDTTQMYNCAVDGVGNLGLIAPGGTVSFTMPARNVTIHT